MGMEKEIKAMNVDFAGAYQPSFTMVAKRKT